MLFPKALRGLFIPRSRWYGAGLLILSLDVLINLVLIASRPGLFMEIPSEPANVAPAPAAVRLPIQTPFQPLLPTPAVPERLSVPAVSPPAPLPSTDYYGVDFRPGARNIKIVLLPQTNKVNRGRPIVILVNPGPSCRFQDHRACISAYREPGAENVILASVHSGIGGEAETYRRAVEGLGLDWAGFSIKLIRSNLARLEGAPVQIIQGDRVLDGFVLTAARRVPPKQIRDFLSGSAQQAMRMAAAADPELGKYASPISPTLVFETCGWRLPGEAWNPGVTSTTGSVYIGIIQKAP